MKAYAVDRELLLMAYEKVTPPRTVDERGARDRLLRQAREIIAGDFKKQLDLPGVRT